MSLGNVIGMLMAGTGFPSLLNIQAGLNVLAGVLVLAVRPRSARDAPDRAAAEQASR
jgi:hypothetical protein